MTRITLHRTPHSFSVRPTPTLVLADTPHPRLLRADHPQRQNAPAVLRRPHHARPRLRHRLSPRHHRFQSMAMQQSRRDGHHLDLREFLAGADAGAVGPGQEGAGFGRADPFVREGRGQVVMHCGGRGRRCDPTTGTPD